MAFPAGLSNILQSRQVLQRRNARDPGQQLSAGEHGRVGTGRMRPLAGTCS